MMTIFIVMFGLMMLGVPIAYSIGLAAALGLLTVTSVPLTVVPQRMYVMLDTFTLLAIPFFVLAGNLMDRGGISKKLINLASCIVGHIRGGLGMVSVFACMLFGTISGSGTATSAAIGSLTIPAMKEKGYDKEFAGAIIAVSGPLGVVIPPSVVMIIYCTTANVSIGRFFLAGYVPGVLLGVFMMVGVYFIAGVKGYPAGEKAPFKALLKALVESMWAILMLVIIVGGIFGGFFTATEAACVAVVYAIFVGRFVYKELHWKDLPEILKKSAMTSSGVLFCVATTNILAWLIINQQLPLRIGAAIGSMVESRFAILFLCNIILLIIGTVIDATPAIIMIVPILLPLAQQFGVDPIHFGVIVVTNLAISMSTPPVGITLFVSSSISGASLTSMIRPMVPIWGIMFAVLMLITYIPAISTALPNYFF